MELLSLSDSAYFKSFLSSHRECEAKMFKELVHSLVAHARQLVVFKTGPTQCRERLEQSVYTSCSGALERS